MSNYIRITGTASTLAQRTRSFIDALQSVTEQGINIKAVMDQVAASSDWASLATELGVSAGEAEAVYNLIAAVNVELAGTNIGQITSRCG